MIFVTIASCLLIGSTMAVQLDVTNTGGRQLTIDSGGNPGHAGLGRFGLGPGQTNTVYAPDGWEGRLWVANEKTLIEAVFKGWGGHDYYDISAVDGYSGPASIRPVGGNGDCKALNCDNPNCGDAYHNPNDRRTYTCQSNHYIITFA